MTPGRQNVLQRIRQAALGREGGPTDGELMERFTARRDADALEALIRRHGPMVLAVCHRVLGNEPDAEDAFQAAFLVFVRKAASIRSRELVGNWLYGVAYRTALKAKGAAARRRVQERRAATMNPTRTDSEDGWAELLPLLDRELNRLPEKYRAAIVLCELEGRPRKEAARKLGVPEGTLSSRLATGKRMLGRRLAPHGLAPSGCVLAAALARATGVPPPLLASTTKAASLFAAGKAATAVASARVAALAEGVMKTMLLTKLSVAVLAALAVVVIGAAAVACRVTAAPAVAPAEPAVPQARNADKPADKPGGLTARIVAPKEVAADDPQVKGELVLTNDGDAPVRVCTLANGNDGLGGAFGQHFRPDWWKSDRPPLEKSAEKVVTLAPGKSVSFPFAINNVHFKDRESFTITGFYAVEEKEFADKLGLWVGKAEAEPVKVAVGKEAAWGDAVDGVQARLVASKAWDLGETPDLTLGMRNNGDKTPHQCRAPNFCEIEWDGQWHQFGGPGELECKHFSLQAGKQVDDWVKVGLDLPWVRKGDKDKRLEIAAGKHTVRVAFLFDDGPRVVSQPVEIEVGKESAWGEADGGVQARFRTPRAVWKAGEAPTFILDLRNQGKNTSRALRIKEDLQIEVDGTWYWYPNEVGRRISYELEAGKQINDWVTVAADKNWEVKTPGAAAGKPDRFPLPAGKHTIRLSYEVSAGANSFRPVSGPVEIEVRQESEEWGEAVDGVQARLRPSKTAWDDGEPPPDFKLDLRNQGKNAHALCCLPQFRQIELDGKWFVYGGPVAIDRLSSPLKPGEEADGCVTVSLADPWVLKTPGRVPGAPLGDKEERLKISPGKHTMRVAFGFDVGDPPPVLPSQPLEIEVGKESAWGKDDGGVQARVRTPKAVWGAKEPPTFIVDLQNVGEKATHSEHIPFDCEIEVDGTWYYYSGPVDVVSGDTKLEPGKHYNDWVKVTPDNLWQEKAPKDKKPRPLLPLSPGKHTIRLAYPVSGEKPPLRLVTEPIEIEIRQEG